MSVTLKALVDSWQREATGEPRRSYVVGVGNCESAQGGKGEPRTKRGVGNIQDAQEDNGTPRGCYGFGYFERARGGNGNIWRIDGVGNLESFQKRNWT